MTSTNGLKKILLLTLTLSAGSAAAFPSTMMYQPIEALDDLYDRALILKNTTSDALIAHGQDAGKKTAPVFVINDPSAHRSLTPLQTLKNAYKILTGTFD